ncbi:MAG TPA: hypothetical protein VHB79_34930 [Polyangiaceae bacterium]|nr:hypothetical protein [Polyangiaceae bacterium]
MTVSRLDSKRADGGTDYRARGGGGARRSWRSVEPHAIDSDEAFAGILATFDAITGGTSGPDAARYNGTLLSLESVNVRRPDETGFGAARQEGPEADTVVVLPPLNGTVSGLTEGQTLTRVVGVYSNYNKYMTFALQPRTAEEVVF